MVNPLAIELDEVDRKIIEILRMDARRPFTDIGKQLGISDATVHVRVKKLMDGGVIKRYTIDVEKSFLGKGTCGFALLNVKPGRLGNVTKRLIREENVSDIHEIDGPSDLLIKIGARDLDDLREVLLKIRKIPSVTGSELITVLKRWKEE